MRKRKPIWLRILTWILSSIFSIIVLLGVGCAFLYFKYEINIFEVVNQVKILNQDVNLEVLCPNAFSILDMESAKIVTDANLDGLISHTETEGYKVTPERVSTVMTNNLKFTDKQIGAILDNIVDNQEKLNIQIGDTINLKDYGFKIIQVAFSNITDTSSDFNIVIKIDLTKIKEEKMGKFPLNWIRKGLPNSLYFSSTTTITKTTNPFEYTTDGKDLTINNLSSNQTKSILKTINTFVKLGDAKKFSKTIGDSFINVLIGNDVNPGLAYSLKEAGATDFLFETTDESNCFVIKK